ncbi:MAG: hydantoinase/oxoprolinase family protein, partial [Actinobacteria bacterium]|nr:hydantoinase/oxoprolinase family protein [Actinomycetota bacterium]
MAHSIAVDMGGTFTDLIALDGDGRIRVAKSLTTPKEPSRGIFDTIRKAALAPSDIDHFVHGTTVGTNMLIERRGPRIGLIATAGFRDLLRIQRIVRPESFDLHWQKPRHLVERALSLEARGRIGAHGEEVEPLNEDDVRAAVARLKEAEVRAIAVAYMFSFLNGAHERRTRAIIHELWPEVYVSISSEVFPQWREYERTSTTVIDAYLKPRIDEYLTSLEAELHEHGARGLLIMRSNGGVMTTASAKAEPVTMIQSGPAGGVIASVRLGQMLAIDPLITADIGGTSFDTCLIAKGRPATTTTTELEFGIPIATPMLNIRSIGAGGGSMAWLDPAGILKVGPQSAGAEPGPACYGRGGEAATSTDANLVLGRLDPQFPLGGDV